MNVQTHWPAERRDAMLALWREGLSASAIGMRLGLTRNAVLGKLYRMRELLGRRAVQARTSAGNPKPRAPRKRKPPHPLKVTDHAIIEPGPALPPVPLEPLPPADALPDGYGFIGPPALFIGGGLDLLEVTDHTCRWPGDDRPWKFCGAAVDPGSRYCLAHRIRGRQ